MRVSGLNEDGDWTFGASQANYLTGAAAVYQNVQTRIRSFVNDWFLDTQDGIDWYTLLGNKGTESEILSEIERVTLQTEFITAITVLNIVRRDENRAVTIQLGITTLFDDNITDELRIEL